MAILKLSHPSSDPSVDVSLNCHLAVTSQKVSLDSPAF
jgi:hypothetical protein